MEPIQSWRKPLLFDGDCMKTLHVISHTHWDREWYLTFQQFRLKLVHLIDKLLDILDADPNFKYFMLDGQTIVLDDYLHMRPEKEKVLFRHIQSGRILIGPWHILPDMFLVSPEAHIRNLLEGARTARKFGPKMPIGYMPDSFGHIGQMPQILSGFGINAAVLWRGMSDQPAELWWKSPDGSKVLLSYLRDSYSNGANLPVHDSELFIEQIAIAGNSLSAHSAVNEYLIMLGTDHMEPSPHTSASIECANGNLPDTCVIHSTLPKYIESIKTQIERLELTIPTVCGELRASDHSNLLPGVLSTRMWIKQRNHYSQNLLEKWAEPFSVFAQDMIPKLKVNSNRDQFSNDALSSKRIRNVAPIIRQTWRLLMENHPHDSICGCSIDQVHNEMKPRFDQVDQIGEEITRQSLQAISLAIETSSDDALSAIVIFNPQDTPRFDVVEVDINIPEEIDRFEIITTDKAVIPYEFLGASNQELANVVLDKKSLRDTIGTITEGRIAGAAITKVKVTRHNTTVTIDAILDDNGQPNILEWHQAEEEIARYEADPAVTHFHVIAHTPRASRIRFVSPEIPAMGWTTIWTHALANIESSSITKISPLFKPILPLVMRFAQSDLVEKLLINLNIGDENKPPFIIQNERFVVEASTTDGTLTITDKHTNTFFNGLNRFVDGGDAGDEYNYSPPISDSLHSPRLISLRVYRHKFVQFLEIKYTLKVPTNLSDDRKKRSTKMVDIPIISRVSLIPGGERVDIHTEVDNTVRDHRLRVHFPAPFEVQEADHDGHFEVVRRSIGVPAKGANWVEDPRPEVPQRAFTDISNGKIGLMIANRGLPEVEVIKLDGGAQSETVLTLLRCVGWLSRDDMPIRQGHAGPGFETPGGQLPGKWGFDYSIIPHKGDWKEAFQLAYSYETPLMAVTATTHPGELATKGSFISHSPVEFVISAVKETENGKGWIVRGYNTSSETIQLNLNPLRHYKSIIKVNLAEEPICTLGAGFDGNITQLVSGHEVVSIMFS
jgi:mannosylglycerate hydrolase